MSLSKKKVMSHLEWFPQSDSVSIELSEVIEEDGKEIMRKQCDRRAFMPGELDKVKAYLGKQECPEIDFLNGKWTPEIIKAHQDKIREYEEPAREIPNA